MSKYTMELRKVSQIYGEDVVKSWFMDYNLTDFLTDDEIKIINERGIWNKQKLANKIYMHYYMREIGFETPKMFKHYAKITLWEIMEKYAPLIYSASIKYDPLVNVDYKEIFNRDQSDKGITTSTSNSTGSTTNTNKAIYSGLDINSDTPQGQINKKDILEGKYATSTNAGESTTESNGTTNSTNETTGNTNNNVNILENYTKHVKGNSGVSATAQRMIQQYRDNIIAIDTNIIKELNILFMGLY